MNFIGHSMHMDTVTAVFCSLIPRLQSTIEK